MCDSKKAGGKVQGGHLKTVASVFPAKKFLPRFDFGDKTEQRGGGDARRSRYLGVGKNPAAIAIG